MAAINTVTPKTIVKPKSPAFMAERRTFNDKPMFVVFQEGKEKDFKQYAYNAGVGKSVVLFQCDKDGDSLLAEMLKFIVENNGMTLDEARRSIAKLYSDFTKYANPKETDVNPDLE